VQRLWVPCAGRGLPLCCLHHTFLSIFPNPATASSPRTSQSLNLGIVTRTFTQPSTRFIIGWSSSHFPFFRDSSGYSLIPRSPTQEKRSTDGTRSSTPILPIRLPIVKIWSIVPNTLSLFLSLSFSLSLSLSLSLIDASMHRTTVRNVERLRVPGAGRGLPCGYVLCIIHYCPSFQSINMQLL